MSSSRSGHSATFDPAAAAAQVRAAALLGRVIAERYRIDEVLAMGGMGAVYRGEHVHMRKRMAIKVLHPETANFPELVARFEREAVVGAHVVHGNVAAASDFGRLDDGSFYLVLEYVDGITLHQLIQQGPLPVARAVDIARQLGSALDAIHQLDIIHRDLKPRNVMLATDKHDLVKLIDFGLARVPLERFAPGAQAGKITGVGVVFGTSGYMAPEVALGMEAVTARSDLYAYGVILYEMFTGLHPFDAKAPGALFLQHRTQPPPPFRERAPGVEVPAQIEAVVMRLLEKAPTHRYDSAIDAVLALGFGDPSELSAGGPDPTPGPAPITTAPARPRRRSALPWVTAGVCVAALGSVVVRSLLPREGGGGAAESASSAAPSGDRPASAAPASADAVGAPSASVAGPTAPSRVDGGTIDGIDASHWRGELHLAADAKSWSRGAEAVLALAELDPELFGEPDVIVAAAAAAVGSELGDAAVADRVYATLGHKLGARGVDVLYEMVSRYGGSKGARRAGELLRQPEVAAQATPAARIALELRDSPCEDRARLYERAAAEGDERTLAILWAMRSPRCSARTGECCEKSDATLEETVKTLRTRLKQ